MSGVAYRYAGATVVFVLAIVVAWIVVAHLYIRFVGVRQYHRRLDTHGLRLKDLFACADARVALVAAVRYNPFAFITSNYDEASEVGRRLSAIDGGEWQLLHWRRFRPTFMLCHRPATGECILAFRGTETEEDDASNRNVTVAVHQWNGMDVGVHRGLRDLLRTFLVDALAAPEFRAALRTAAPRTVTIIGYSLGGMVAAALTVLLRNEGLAAAVGINADALAGLRADLRGADLRCVAYAAPPGFRFLSRTGRRRPDLHGIVSVIKEGDAVPLLTLANISSIVGSPFVPAVHTLHPVGDVLLVRDEDWRGRDREWLVNNRDARATLQYYFFRVHDDAIRLQQLLGYAALFEALPVAFDGRELTRPLHAHGRWRETMDAVAAEATAAGFQLPVTPHGVAD